jgi:hypothetical protein
MNMYKIKFEDLITLLIGQFDLITF